MADAMSEAVQKAGERLLEGHKSIRAAVDSLDLGFGYDELEAFAQNGSQMDGSDFGAALGLVLIAVEADRARHGR